MKVLKNILAVLGVQSESELEISEITISSKEAVPGSLFIALEGEHTSGARFAAEARQLGAVAVLADHDFEGAIYVPQLHSRLEVLARYFYNYDDSLTLFGVTGTTGKSTLSYLISSLLNGFGEKTLLLTTTPGVPNSLECELTTPDPIHLYRAFYRAREEGYRNVVMECSSIGMALKRIERLYFKAMFITNITSDHLDFHHTKRNYRKTKIDYCLGHTGQIFVLDKFPYLRHLKKEQPRIHRLSSRVSDCHFTSSNTTFALDRLSLSTLLLLPFNLDNVLLAFSGLRVLGYDSLVLKEILKGIPPLPGRVEKILPDQEIYLDYAHSSIAVESLLKDFRRTFHQPLIVIIGAGGDRDKSKRSDYRRSLKRHADIAILTSDNPRDEDPVAILSELAGREDFIILPDRRRAIEAGVKIYQTHPGSILLIVGKGPEEYQIIKGKRLPFSDREEVKRCLKE